MNAANELDVTFLGIITDFSKAIIKTSSTAAAFLLELSKNFLSKEEFSSVKTFQDLYFSESGVKETTTAINRDVDDLILQIQGMLFEGNEVKAENVQEKQTAVETRLHFSALQKQLETIISFNQDVKNKLLPIINSMKFEELVRNRLSNVSAAWEQLITLISSGGKVDEGILEDNLAVLFKTQEEIDAFYRAVLGREAPQDLIVNKSIFENFM